MQTILGSGGAIGIELAKALKEYTPSIRLVSRNPKKVNPSDELFPADLRIKEEVQRAVAGSTIVYVTTGLPYNTKVWQEQWPLIIENVVAACKESQAKLVFFDNIYMYDPNYMPNLTEETPIRPFSEKGKVRARLVKMIMDEVKEGRLTALIARAADFYGPDVKTSILTETVIKPLSQRKKANWMSSVNYKHSFTYTPDAGKATALLGNTEDAFNQVWHLPTAANPYTGKEWVEKIATELGVAPKYRAVSKTLVKIMGFFVPVMKELVEMMYQYDRDYVFHSTRFEEKFGIKPTPYEEGIKEIIKDLNTRNNK